MSKSKLDSLVFFERREEKIPVKRIKSPWKPITDLPPMFDVDSQMKRSDNVLVNNGIGYEIAYCELYDGDAIWYQKDSSDNELSGLTAWMPLPPI